MSDGRHGNVQKNKQIKGRYTFRGQCDGIFDLLKYYRRRRQKCQQYPFNGKNWQSSNKEATEILNG